MSPSCSDYFCLSLILFTDVRGLTHTSGFDLLMRVCNPKGVARVFLNKEMEML